MKQLSDYEKVALIVERIERGNFSIADSYDDFLHVGFAFASDLGEQGRDLFHRVCRLSSKYTSYETENRKYDNCLNTGRGEVHLGTFFKLAEDAGVDTTLPETVFPEEPKSRRGRPKKTEEEKEEERKNLFERIHEWIDDHYEFQLNGFSEQIEMKKKGQEDAWHALDERAFNTLLTKLHAADIHVAKTNLESYISSEMLAPIYNPVEAYAQTLKPWRPGSKDYIAVLFDHLGLEKDENTDYLLKMAKLWYVWMVAVALGLDISNQLMLILAGELEGSGKTSFVERFLPRPLRRYIHRVVELSKFKDKDELLALARNMVCFLDEIQINNTTLNKLKNYIGGGAASAITERTHFGHFAVMRKVHTSWIGTTNKEVFLPDNTGDRRFVVLPITHRGRDYKTLPQERAFAQAYYLATHPKAFKLEITPEDIEKLKEINEKYVAQDLCTVLIPTILRKPHPAEQAQAVSTGEIIGWLTSRTGPNREFTAPKVGISMRKLGFEPKKTKQGMRYLVVRVMMDELERENKRLANQALEPEMPF